MKFKLVKEEDKYSLYIYNNNGNLFQKLLMFTTCPVFAEYTMDKYKKQFASSKVLFR